ncbi:MAG: cupredoxin domain-containing protein [Planctomycetota bacterium]
MPSEIRVPAGAEITFRLTSADVVHGFQIEGTRVNVMLLPGQITELTYTFREPGEHILICHEYCGINHHLMSGRVVVE